MAEVTETDTPEAADHGGEDHAHESRWPLPAALGAGALYFGAGLYFVGLDLVPTPIPVVLVGVGVLGLVGGLAGWTYEAFVAAALESRGTTRDDVYTAGMILFLVSDVATFSAGFVYYAFVRAGAWPPEHLPPVLGSLVVVNTALLVASSVTLHYGHEALEAGDRRRFLGLLGATVALGVVFLGGQIFEYYELLVAEEFTLASGVYGSAFFGLTGLHGLHVALGVVLLGLTFGRALRGEYAPERDTGIRTASLYWHFVDGVWLFLVLVLYVGATLGAS